LEYHVPGFVKNISECPQHRLEITIIALTDSSLGLILKPAELSMNGKENYSCAKITHTFHEQHDSMCLRYHV